MIIKNDSDSVKVMKAVGQPNLRIFPGFNDVGDIDLKPYKNKVTESWFDNILSSPDADRLKDIDIQQAKYAKEKNDELNRAQLVIKQSVETISENEEVISDQKDLIKEQGDAIKEQGDLITTLMEKIAKLETPAEDKKTGKDKKKDKK